MHRLVSLLYVTERGESAESAVVGNEGIVGIALFMGGEEGTQWPRRPCAIATTLSISSFAGGF